MSNLFKEAMQRQIVDLKAMPKAKKYAAASYLAESFPDQFWVTVRGLMAYHAPEWSVCIIDGNPYHFSTGMEIRNRLRARGFDETTMGVENLDNVYVSIVECGLKIWEKKKGWKASDLYLQSKTKRTSHHQNRDIRPTS